MTSFENWSIQIDFTDEEFESVNDDSDVIMDAIHLLQEFLKSKRIGMGHMPDFEDCIDFHFSGDPVVFKKLGKKWDSPGLTGVLFKKLCENMTDQCLNLARQTD